jgi:hypothetical protein
LEASRGPATATHIFRTVRTSKNEAGREFPHRPAKSPTGGDLLGAGLLPIWLQATGENMHARIPDGAIALGCFRRGLC